MAAVAELARTVQEVLGDRMIDSAIAYGELTITVDRDCLREACLELRDNDATAFEQLIDLCGVDYSAYRDEAEVPAVGLPRFAAAYHLLSVQHNRRIRVKTYLDADLPTVASVCDIWESADWFEREAFDLFGIVFENHPDLRRLLTDYGFVGHPFRKDFPLSGYVEMRYDPEKGRVVYEPVTIEPRTLVPRPIREDDFGHRDS